MKKLVVVYGTRPELIKVIPLIKALKKEKGIETITVSTQQHIDMLVPLENFFNIKPDYCLDVMRPNQTINTTISKVINKTEELFMKIKPDLVFIQGDTSTVLATGISCFNQKIKVAHIEAGLRSFNLEEPFPEEFNRKIVSSIARYNFAPTKISADNLKEEKLSDEKIFITGNTVIDSVRIISEKLNINRTKTNNTILVTAHRRENHGKGIIEICEAVKEICQKHPDINFVWPVHPNPNVKDIVYGNLKNIEQVKLLPPLDYFDLLQEMANAKLIWTDSGGIQEEAPFFKKPLLILRNVTERPEVVESGFGLLVGTETSLIIEKTEQILSNSELYNKMIEGQNPFGDGFAANKIIDIVKNDL